MIVAVAGRRIDVDDALQTRFPLAMRRSVERRIIAALKHLEAEVVVSSAACGADLLALRAATLLHLRKRIVLPYAEATFLTDSVTDRPGRWRVLYATMCAEARATDDLIILDEQRGTDEAFRTVTEAIIKQAQALAAHCSLDRHEETLAGLVVWDGKPRGYDDLTEYFRVGMVSVGADVVEVSTLPQTLHA